MQDLGIMEAEYLNFDQVLEYCIPFSPHSDVMLGMKNRYYMDGTVRSPTGKVVLGRWYVGTKLDVQTYGNNFTLKLKPVKFLNIPYLDWLLRRVIENREQLSRRYKAEMTRIVGEEQKKVFDIRVEEDDEGAHFTQVTIRQDEAKKMWFSIQIDTVSKEDNALRELARLGAVEKRKQGLNMDALLHYQRYLRLGRIGQVEHLVKRLLLNAISRRLPKDIECGQERKLVIVSVEKSTYYLRLHEAPYEHFTTWELIGFDHPDFSNVIQVKV